MLPACLRIRLSTPLVTAAVAGTLAAAFTDPAWANSGVSAPSSAASHDPASDGPSSEHAEGNRAAPELSARLGYAFFMHARSIALEHKIKPALRLTATWPAFERIDIGAAAHGVLDSSPNYGVWAAYGVGRYRILDGSFALNASLGVGVGHDAAILHPSLQTTGSILPYAYLGIEALFSLSDDWKLGIELADEQLSVLHFGAAVCWNY